MESLESKLFRHILTFFSAHHLENGKDASEAEPEPRCPDVLQLVLALGAAGFRVGYHDKSEVGVTGGSEGCKLIVVCKRSGARVVMDGKCPCSCLPEEEMVHTLRRIRERDERAATTTESSKPPGPGPGRDSGESEDSLALGEEACTTKLVRQHTWSRELAVDPGDLRRQSAPPLPAASAQAAQANTLSPWASVTGDDLNVAAATDLLREALSLLSGIKRPTIRNTPILPGRLSAAAPGRRLPFDAHLSARRSGGGSLSRSSSVSSGLASSYSSTREQPEPPRSSIPKAAPSTGTSTALRRTLSSAASGESVKKGDSTIGTRTSNPRSFASKLPSYLKGSQPKAPRSISNSSQQQTASSSVKLP